MSYKNNSQLLETPFNLYLNPFADINNKKLKPFICKLNKCIVN